MASRAGIASQAPRAAHPLLLSLLPQTPEPRWLQHSIALSTLHPSASPGLGAASCPSSHRIILGTWAPQGVGATSDPFLPFQQGLLCFSPPPPSLLHPHHRLPPACLQDSVPSSSRLPFLLPSYFMKKTKAINPPHLSPYRARLGVHAHFPPSRLLLAHLTHPTWNTSSLSPRLSALIFKGPPSTLDFPSRSHPMSHSSSFTVRLLRIVTPAHYLCSLISCSLLGPLQSGFSHNSALSAHRSPVSPNH